MQKMDKVDFTAPSLAGATLQRNSRQETRKAKAKDGPRTFFSDILESFAPQGGLGPLKEFTPSDEALAALEDAVHSAGDALRDRPFQKEILDYKRAVRNFINYVVENAFEIEKSQTRRGGRQKIYSQIRVIDGKLEELAAAILSGQTSQLERVSKLDEIKGLLVDLTITGVIKERDE
jgi:uncharacterized protein YaaR (DUF327 family)